MHKKYTYAMQATTRQQSVQGSASLKIVRGFALIAVLGSFLYSLFVLGNKYALSKVILYNDSLYANRTTFYIDLNREEDALC